MGKFFKASLRMIYRDKQALFWALAFPIIFAVIFGLFDFNAQADIRVTLVDSPAMLQQAHDGVESALKQVDFFEVSRAATVEAAKAKITDDKADIALALEPGSAQPELTLQTFYNEGNPQQNQVAFTALGRVVDGMNLHMAQVEPAITLQRDAVTDKSISYYDFILPGLVAMGIMNVAIVGIAVGITKFREQQILKRILATPARTGDFLVAQVLARLVLAMIQAALILAVGVFLFGANIYGNVAYLFVLAAIGNLIFLNIGFAVAGRSKTEDAAQGLAQAIALPMMFLSGVFFPTETLPTVIANIVRFLPLTPLIQAMRKVALDGASLAQCGTQLAALAAWVVVSFLLARSLFSFAEKD